MVASGRVGGAQFIVCCLFCEVVLGPRGDFADRSVGFQRKIGRLRAAVVCELSLNVSLDCLDY
jgi:hypothetical protein